jgi:ABC-type glutathione transport system ATPase component
VGDETVLLKDFLADDKKITAPNYKPIEVVVSHLTHTVKAAPPQKKQLTVATQLNLVAKAKEKKESLDLLHDVSLALKPGEMTLLLGAPGSWARPGCPSSAAFF